MSVQVNIHRVTRVTTQNFVHDGHHCGSLRFTASDGTEATLFDTPEACEAMAEAWRAAHQPKVAAE